MKRDSKRIIILLDELEELDHKWFGCWLDVSPCDYDKLETDFARLWFVLNKIHEFRRAIGIH